MELLHGIHQARQGKVCCHATTAGVVWSNDVTVRQVVSPHGLHDVVCSGTFASLSMDW